MNNKLTEKEIINNIKKNLKDIYFMNSLAEKSYVLTKLHYLLEDLHETDVLGRDLIDDYVTDEIVKQIREYPGLLTYDEELSYYENYL